MEVQLILEKIEQAAGKDNILSVEAEASRLLITVKEIETINMNELEAIADVRAVKLENNELNLLLGKHKAYEAAEKYKQKKTHHRKEDKQTMWNTLFSKFQVFGKAIMLPIALLPAAGLLLGIGGAFSNPNTISSYPFLDLLWLQAIFTLMSSAGNVIFSNLPLIFSIGIATGLVKSDKGAAGLAAVLAYLVMNASINAILTITDSLAVDNLAAAGQGMSLGIQTLETGVFGGVIAGLMTAALHKRYNKKQLPQFLGFFSGARFVPIVTSFTAIALGALMFIIWPPIQNGIASMGSLVEVTGYFGTFIFGFIVKLLGPLGLHHIFYLPFWQTGLGGSMVINGETIAGTQNIFFSQLGDPNTTSFYEGTSRFMSGKFFTCMFGLLGAALAIYHTAKPENRAKIGGLLATGALTSFLTGITEPLEFTFLFVAPLLFIVHAAMWGIAYMTAHLLDITIGMTFSAGLIDFMLFGILQGNEATNWYLVPLAGIVFFAVYYGIFRFLIVKFNFKTPGREEENGTSTEMNSNIDNTSTERSDQIIAALGGSANISDVDCCATRLRVTVTNGEKVSKDDLMKTGAKGVFIRGQGIQAIYGPQVTIINTEISEKLDL